ncbi:hypothetical protein IZS40_001724 [Salmonella enterica subsp. enterica serovar Typhimurium]|nr:hypothetical protein [Salmonella enterica subsp. enterica serovar Typhimurium]
MPVVDVPGMIGSSAKEETGKEWMSEATANRSLKEKYPGRRCLV